MGPPRAVDGIAAQSSPIGLVPPRDVAPTADAIRRLFAATSAKLRIGARNPFHWRNTGLASSRSKLAIRSKSYLDMDVFCHSTP